MQKKTVAVIFGGVSSEHEVSRLSVTSVLQNMDDEKYEKLIIGITRTGEWYLYHGPVADIADGSWEKKQKTPCMLSPDRSHHGFLMLRDGRYDVLRTDVIFPVLHGKNGEDGTIQGLFELSGVPYVGCGVAASANCMDKDITKRLLTAAGIPNAKWITVCREEETEQLPAEIEAELGWPVFVKPASAGSSVGVSKAADAAALQAALKVAFEQDDKVIIEETITGSEVECAVMGRGGDAFAARELGEVVPTRELYDYEGKYLDTSAGLHIPARIPAPQAQSIRSAAVEAYRALGCSGLARVDFFALPDGSYLLNEINTLPGFTSISMYPKLMMTSAMTYAEIIDRLIDLALQDGGEANG